MFANINPVKNSHQARKVVIDEVIYDFCQPVS